MFGVYIISVAKTPPSMIIDAMEDISSDIKNDIMTTYDQLIEKGKIEGVKTGLKEGQYKEKVEVILNGMIKVWTSLSYPA